jgi:MFS transporter, DHA3 family, macrolide efflux protein
MMGQTNGDTVSAGDEERSSSVHNRGWRLVKTWDFGWLWWGQITSQVGEGLSRVALLWFVYELTGSALMMTVVGLLQTIPPLLFGPVIGVYLDRLPKKTVMVWVDATRTIMTFLIPALYGLGLLSIEWLYVLIFLTSIVSTIFGPALVSVVPLLVKKSELVSANALVQSTNNIGTLVGPAISGIGIALIGAQNVLFVNAATFLISALCLLPIRVHAAGPEATREGAPPSETVLQELRAGFSFVFGRQHTVFLLAIIAGLYNIGASAFVFLLPVFAKEELQVGPVQLGWLWSSLGIGMLLASTWLASIRQGDMPNRLRIIARAMTVGGLAACILSMLETTFFAAGLIMIIGGSTALFYPVVWALLQEMTPAHMMGRVLTTFSTGSMASAMAGMTGFGWAADALGPATSLVGLGLVLLLTAGVAAQFSRHPLIKPVAVA